MFDIGFWELATIAIIGIVVVGPERLPEVVRTIAAYVRKARRAFQDVKADIEHELDLDELRRQMHDVDMEDHIKKLNQSVMDMGRNIHNTASHVDHELRSQLDLNDPEVRAAFEDDNDVDRYADTGIEPDYTTLYDQGMADDADPIQDKGAHHSDDPDTQGGHHSTDSTTAPISLVKNLPSTSHHHD